MNLTLAIVLIIFALVIGAIVAGVIVNAKAFQKGVNAGIEQRKQH